MSKIWIDIESKKLFELQKSTLKWYLTLLVTKVMQIKTTMQYGISSIHLYTSNESSYTNEQNVTWCHYFWKQFGSFLKVKHKLVIPRNYTPKNISMKNKNWCPHRHVMHVLQKNYSKWPSTETIPMSHQ